MKTKPKRKTKSKSSARVVPISESRFQGSITTIGFDASGLPSAKKLKLKYPDLKAKLGGKAAGLAEMARLNVPVPPSINLSTELCNIYLARQRLPEAALKNLDKAMRALEATCKKKFGSTEEPLLVSVRSGARVSMPGMMDTILNLGLNNKIVSALATAQPHQARFWWDCYRRLIVMFADVVMGLDRYAFERALDSRKNRAGVRLDSELSADDLRDLCEEQLLLIRDQGKEFPQDPKEQLIQSIEAVFRSWNTDRATHYRQIHKIPEDWGTSVTIQSMVFGNKNEKSGTGVVFTRDPSSGAKKLFGEFLINAQGEDVVAGIRNPEPIKTLEKLMPKLYRQLAQILKRLEEHFADVQDVEFTVEDSNLYVLQTRSAKRTASATLENLLQFVNEKRITKTEALERLSYDQAKALLHPSLKPTSERPLAKALPAAPGAVSGKIALDPEQALQMAQNGDEVILVRRETSPEDIVGMNASVGILTATGGMTSHAAVVGRGMGKTCIVGCTDLRIFDENRQIELSGARLKEGDWLTLDGSSGSIFKGKLPTEAISWNKSAKKFFSWADQESELEVLANADTEEQASRARELGAKGIGLCRTEHMFFEAERLAGFRRMILADDESERERYANELLKHQREDFIGIFKAMKDLEVSVRLLDPPLHEFLPPHTHRKEIAELAEQLSMNVDTLSARIQQLQEVNPMLGHRGCRLAISFPAIYRMQVKALADAFNATAKSGNRLRLKVMLPLIGSLKELEYLLDDLKPCFEDALENRKLSKRVKWGTMIEVPRACLMAGELAEKVDFFSFGTNDLTQTCLGLSRDDAGRFLPAYVSKKIYDADPFEKLDQSGVGRLVEMAVSKARLANPGIEIGVCGEHGGDPSSIEFFKSLEFDTVSCSTYRVPIARMAAGRASSQGRTNKLSKKKKK